jgi:hypothetical protein
MKSQRGTRIRCLNWLRSGGSNVGKTQKGLCAV